MNVFTYVRVSGIGQVDKDGPIRQREAIAGFCDKHGLRLASEYFEEGVSGTIESMDRPRFSEMLLKIDSYKQLATGVQDEHQRDKKRRAQDGISLSSAITVSDLFIIDAIVVERMDRLARDLMVSEFLLRECRMRGIKVFCVDQGDLTDMASNEGDPTRVMFRQILGAIAQWEKSVTVRKLHVARLRRRKEGHRCEGKKRYGRFNVEEGEIKEEISRMKKEGLSYTRIADMLNARGFLTRHGKKWNKTNVHTVDSGRRTSEAIERQESNHARSNSPIREIEGMLRGQVQLFTENGRG